jgi:cysteine-rich repeat protein
VRLATWFRLVLTSTTIVIVGACFNPTYDNPQCGPAGECPADLTCVQGVCVSGGGEVDAATDASADASTDGPTDAPTDGPPIDAPIDGPGVDAPTPVCGDGTRTSPEVCDDGNTVTESRCPYGTATCTLCNSSCTMVLNLTGPICGDGVIEPGVESCDDRNELACGTCNATCTMPIAPASATGRITADVGANIQDGERFVLDDGFNPPRVFEFDRDMIFMPGNTQVFIQPVAGAGQVADSIAMAINGSGLFIQAMHVSGPSADLFHQRQSSLGNRPIVEMVMTTPFSVMGMSGGAAGDCPAGTGCTDGAVCASQTCSLSSNACQ